jgi:sterol desaturase/sphingolipid hydroxylase (fatty acid hydroxylase superfamily)
LRTRLNSSNEHHPIFDATLQSAARLRFGRRAFTMSIVSLEHSKSTYWADYAAYAVIVMGLFTALVLGAPATQWAGIVTTTLAGLAAWTLVEYVMHRFVLHGLEPFQGWHLKHHDRPTALISAPTILSATLIAGLVFLPALLLIGPWHACALTLGLTIGYFIYALTHHATHHWRADNAWLKRRKSWHAMHHHAHGDKAGCYGVSSSFWDRVFRSSAGT